MSGQSNMLEESLSSLMAIKQFICYQQVTFLIEAPIVYRQVTRMLIASSQ
jgi:hypothetical protein